MDHGLTLAAYQELAARTDRVNEKGPSAIMTALLGLAGETGSLLTEYKKWFREGERYRVFTDQVAEELGDILWYVANIAHRSNLNLEEIAQENLAKLADRWPVESPTATLFADARYDDSFPVEEQLPKAFRVLFEPFAEQGRVRLRVSMDGNTFGDPLTDNSHAEDGYRFHDVFHFSLASLLGWSPITRKLLQRKRKSSPVVDEVEDGARAAITEEAISALVFGFAREYSMFDRADAVSYELLRTVRLMVRPFEVRNASLGDWENVILQSFSVWRRMIESGGGVLVADADKNLVEFLAM